MTQKLIQQGAEAKILLDEEKGFVIKDRIKKSYRIRELDDKIRKQRTKAETKLLERASRVINAPKPEETRDFYQIKMPFIDGKKLSENLDSFPLEKQKEILRLIGEEIGKLHEADIIHGDLTTSNMILVGEDKNNLPAHSHSQININVNNENLSHISIKKQRRTLTKSGSEQDKSVSDSECIFFFDFGLGFISKKIEDKAVDLHLLKQALEAKHFRNWEILFDSVVDGYRNYVEAEKVLERLKAVEKRGRYKH